MLEKLGINYVGMLIMANSKILKIRLRWGSKKLIII